LTKKQPIKIFSKKILFKKISNMKEKKIFFSKYSF
jgi:hypothetical protein